MAPLSANTIFHFTKSKDALVSILTNGFYPRYCHEQDYINTFSTWYIPMVCFCDIPLSQISDHSSFYGRYAIGMSKEWAIKSSINPVLYVNEEVEVMKKLKGVFDYFERKWEVYKENGEKKKEEEMVKRRYELYFPTAFLKPYEGRFYKKKEMEEITKRFYDEREWRYVPVGKKASLFKFHSITSSHKEQENIKLQEYSLPFEIKDIKYIIVAKEEDILSLKNEIDNIYLENSPNDLALLSTRIISLERIKEDF